MKDRLVLPPPERREAVLALIQSARQRLALSVFRCDDFDVLDALVAAARRSVQVNILITRRARGWKRRLKDLAVLLQSAGVQVQRYSGPVRKYHAKYMIADDEIALIGSLNFTRRCFQNTCDFILISQEHEMVSGLKRLFDSDYHTPFMPAPEISNSLIIGPDHSRQRLTALLEGARQSIQIIDHRVSDPAIIGLLETKAREGVSVEIFGRGNIAPLESHGKMLLVDKAVAVIGSIAFSQPSLDLRREVAVEIRDPELIHELNEFVAGLLVRNSAAQHGVVSFWQTPESSWQMPESSEDDDEEGEDENDDDPV
jgi:phosphatidylserine/phosphatidylglycerophosphate/cardiolipin synthase-like enzyme